MQNKQIDLVIIGAGPAGIFTALEMLKSRNPVFYGVRKPDSRRQPLPWCTRPR